MVLRRMSVDLAALLPTPRDRSRPRTRRESWGRSPNRECPTCLGAVSPTSSALAGAAARPLSDPSQQSLLQNPRRWSTHAGAAAAGAPGSGARHSASSRGVRLGSRATAQAAQLWPRTKAHVVSSRVVAAGHSPHRRFRFTGEAPQSGQRGAPVWDDPTSVRHC